MEVVLFVTGDVICNTCILCSSALFQINMCAQEEAARILWIWKGMVCSERACCVQGRFLLSLNHWSKRESFERKGLNGFKKCLKIFQINEICRKGKESNFFFFDGLSNSKT